MYRYVYQFYIVFTIYSIEVFENWFYETVSTRLYCHLNKRLTDGLYPYKVYAVHDIPK